MRARPFALMAVCALMGVSAFTMGATAAQMVPTMVVSGKGLVNLSLGASQSSSVALLKSWLGPASTPLTSTPDLRLCGVGDTAAWGPVGAYFNHQRLVGLSFGPGRSLHVRTTAGLRRGDTLARARALYGQELMTSRAQGGAWFVTTSPHRIDGFLNPSSAKAPSSSAKIWTIDVGVVGCPAESP